MRLSTCIVLLTSWCSAYAGYAVNEAPNIKFPGVPKPRFDGYPTGHNEQLGMQRPSSGQVPEYWEIPTPKELWDKHVKMYRPAILRGALYGSPALDNWISDDYLIEHYGDQEVLVEKKFEDRKSEPKRMTIEGFLGQYKLHNWYVVSMLPDVMRHELKVPKPLMCSNFRENLQELNLWIGTRGTRSVLHFDADNIIHCLVSGRKDWLLIHPDYIPQIDMVLGTRGQGSGFSHLKVDSIDTTKHPELGSVPWEHATIYGGDCLYLPPQYLHQVRSHNRSISATYLFYPRDFFNDDDCKDVDLDSYLSLDKVYVAWTYKKNQETVDMGYQNPINVRKQFLHSLEATDTTWLTYKMMAILQFAAQGEELIQKSEILGWFIKNVDANGDKNITIQEIRDLDIEIWKEWCRKLESPHGPTRSELGVNDQKTNKSAEFNPRDNDYFVDAKDTLKFLKKVINKIGTNGTMSYPVFKENVLIGQGTHSEAFVLIDSNMNGFTSIQELENLDLKFIRDFQKTVSSYWLKGTDIKGGGNFEEDFRDGKADEAKARELKKNIIQYFVDLQKHIKDLNGELNFDQFIEFSETNPFLGFDYFFYHTFLFHLLDKGQKGYIKPEELDMYIDDSNDFQAAFPENPDDAPVVKKDRTTLIHPRSWLQNALHVAADIQRRIAREKEREEDDEEGYDGEEEEEVEEEGEPQRRDEL